jgi:hypothetical protein
MLKLILIIKFGNRGRILYIKIATIAKFLK